MNTLTTIRKIIIRGRFIPYIACFLFLEIYHLAIMLSLLYGRGAAAAAGTAASMLLCWTVISVFYDTDRGKAALLIFFDLHIALCAAMFFRFAAGHPLAVPLWIALGRIALFLPEIAAVYILTGKERTSKG